MSVIAENVLPADIKVSVIKGEQRLYLQDVPRLVNKENITNPQCVIWYGGQYGLTARARDFYKEKFFDPLEKEFNNLNFNVWLYDLHAWKGFRDVLISLKNAYCKAIKKLATQDKKYIAKPANEFFLALEKATNDEREFFIEILKRAFVWNISSGFKTKGIECKKIELPQWLGDAILHKDTMEVYSALQYIEGLWLVREIVKKQINIDSKKAVNILYILPGGDNPEVSYYIDRENPEDVFAADIKHLLEVDKVNKIQAVEVNIHFYGFNYSPPIEMCGILKLARADRPWIYFQGDVLVDAGPYL